MDWVRCRDTCMDFLKKYRYGLLVVAVGLVLMSLPGKSPPDQAPAAEPTAPAADPGAELERILSGIAGAGQVQVMLTVARGEETVYESNLDTDTGETTSSQRKDTVVITGSDRREQGLVRQVNPPVYQGAVVLCQGAGRPSVRLAVVEAVSCATGLGADQISVLKMK